ncbi:MAG: sulfotransferase [Lapillicoccus sp.]
MAAGGWRDGPTVLYVAGSGRSGSTLVERAIGAVPGFCNVGEALDLFRGALSDDQRCGCGEPLSTCPFWSQVVATSAVLADPARVARMTTLQSALVRQRQLPRMLVAATRRGAFGRDLQEYAEGYAEIFQAVSAVSGARYVVDASKWPVQALALSLSGTDVRVVQVVRDPRGVAHSQSKSDVARPQAGLGATMDSRPALSAAVRWTASQSQVDLLRLRGLPTSLVRYEDFVRDPGETVRRGLADVGVGVGPGDLGHLRPGVAELPGSHGISGNPSRFRLGRVELRADEAWRTGLPPGQQKAVLALASPQLLRLGRARRPVSTATTSTPTSPGGPSS